jgi:mono/diheme cytochrome c family protein
VRGRFRITAVVWASALLLSAAVFVACGGGSQGERSAATPSSTRPARVEDARLRASDFRNVNTMTRVGDHFVTNVRGHLAAALAVARSPRGGTYPVGTILQLVPQEAMVKRAAGFSPSTNDWEFFSLDVSPAGTKILSRGGAQVVNRFGGSCASCHSAARSKFDFVCGNDHGCAPLPVGPDVFAALQKADPRPR